MTGTTVEVRVVGVLSDPVVVYVVTTGAVIPANEGNVKVDEGDVRADEGDVNIDVSDVTAEDGDGGYVVDATGVGIPSGPMDV